MVDWSEGAYERTADRLLPAAQVAVAALAPRPGERVVDVGCGTGNAALLAARAGARVTGVDPAGRLLDVARERLAAEGLAGEMVAGTAEALPGPDDGFDAAVSVFGVIFGDPKSSAAELVRVVRPGGRIVVTTWSPEGPTPKAGAAVRAALGAPPEVPRWSDPRFVERLFAGHRVEQAEHGVSFAAASPDAYVAEQVEHHPLWSSVAPQLGAAGRLDEVVARMVAIFAEANEDPAAFRTTSRYVVTRVEVAGQAS